MCKNKTSVTNEVTFIIRENKNFPCKRNQSDCLKQQFPQKKKKKKKKKKEFAETIDAMMAC